MKNKRLTIVIIALLIVVAYQAFMISSSTNLNYTIDDMNRVRDIILGKTEVTEIDYLIYDLNNDRELDILDAMIIKRHVLGIEKIPERKVMNNGRTIQRSSR